MYSDPTPCTCMHQTTSWSLTRFLKKEEQSGGECVLYLGLLLYFAAAGGEENTEGFNPKLGDTGGWRLIGELLNTLIHQLSYALLTDRGRFQHILVEQLSNQSDSPYRPLVDLVLCLLLHLERLPLLEVKGY